MIHLFDDITKEKIPIVFIKGTAEDVTAAGIKSVTLTADQLLTLYGIEDLNDYVFMSAEQTISDRGLEYWVSGIIPAGSQVMYPFVIKTDDSLQVDVSNNTGSIRDIPWRVVLMKVE